ncbi:hypothetical protein [Rosenbergiella nectarea]|nr:hypothetical protein [Rosenbergiella nectarea]MBT0729599.1 hypothetical protein [Rosenbergiella nectarea subsp. apis]
MLFSQIIVIYTRYNASLRIDRVLMVLERTQYVNVFVPAKDPKGGKPPEQ